MSEARKRNVALQFLSLGIAVWKMSESRRDHSLQCWSIVELEKEIGGRRVLHFVVGTKDAMFVTVCHLSAQAVSCLAVCHLFLLLLHLLFRRVLIICTRSMSRLWPILLHSSIGWLTHTLMQWEDWKRNTLLETFRHKRGFSTTCDKWWQSICAFSLDLQKLGHTKMQSQDYKHLKEGRPRVPCSVLPSQFRRLSEAGNMVLCWINSCVLSSDYDGVLLFSFNFLRTTAKFASIQQISVMLSNQGMCCYAVHDYNESWHVHCAQACTASASTRHGTTTARDVCFGTLNGSSRGKMCSSLIGGTIWQTQLLIDENQWKLSSCYCSSCPYHCWVPYSLCCWQCCPCFWLPYSLFSPSSCWPQTHSKRSSQSHRLQEEESTRTPPINKRPLASKPFGSLCQCRCPMHN